MDDCVVIAPPPPPSRRVLMLANTQELIVKNGKKQYTDTRARHLLEGPAMLSTGPAKPDGPVLRVYDPNNPWYKSTGVAPGKGGLRVDAGHALTRSTLEPLGELLAANPWVPAGPVSKSYDAAVQVPVGESLRRLAKEDEEKVVERLYTESTERQKTTLDRLHGRYCPPKKEGRKLKKKDMDHQYKASVAWEKKVKAKQDAALQPKPPPAKEGARGRRPGPEPLKGSALAASIARLHKGATHEDADTQYGDHREKLYRKYDVVAPPPTYIHTAQGKRPYSEKLGQAEVQAMATRLCDKSMEHKQGTMNGLIDKYVTQTVKEHPLMKKDDTAVLVDYLYTKGERPGYREGQSPRKK
eukprot:TRINITY_DN25589_c0_g1_i1.p1 TRINITY_DN25589_c0_g1~~TRINITY_DN25589_c0_g1_i1.p1  ORF type:complete len:396 (+),score=171.15 TRINITY_DN25589_c0_g1_i1:124-1188(+)